LSGATFVPSLGGAYRAKIAELAKRHVGDDQWVSAFGLVTCNLFVGYLLLEASNATMLSIPPPTRWFLNRFYIPRNGYILAADWANPDYEDKNNCWRPVAGGPDNSLPGDVLATGFPPGGPDTTGHVGFVVSPSVVDAPTLNQPLTVSFASSASDPPYWWDAPAKAAFQNGTITLTDYGFRLPGYDVNNPQANQGLKRDSRVKRFMCY
jgi:hypothetical protein